MKSLSCPNRRCSRSRKSAAGSIIRHGFYKTRWGKRRRFQCRICRKTFCANTATPYYRLQLRRATFDEVATFSVEGMNKSAIARVKGLAWNTVHRWLERAAAWCRRFNRKINRLCVVELQADEIRTIVGGKERPIWIFAVIEVWSRFWPSTVVGKRSYPKHARPLSKRFQPNESRTDSSDRHGWIGILRESRQTSLWASVSLWPGHQDAQERLHREGGAKSGAWRHVEIGTGAA
jgi:transposase-like protein